MIYTAYTSLPNFQMYQGTIYLPRPRYCNFDFDFSITLRIPKFKFTTASKQNEKISKSNPPVPPCFPPGNILICMNGPDLDRARLTSIRRFVST